MFLIDLSSIIKHDVKRNSKNFLRDCLKEVSRERTQGPVTIPTIAVLGRKVRSNLVFKVQFFVLIPNLASDLPYVPSFGGKSTSKFGLPALFKRLAFRL
jgi:hypothetical protein